MTLKFLPSVLIRDQTQTTLTINSPVTDWQMTKFDSKFVGETLGPDMSVIADNVKNGTTHLKVYFIP